MTSTWRKPFRADGKPIVSASSGPKDFHGQTVAAISVAVPSQRTSDARLLELANLARRAAEAVSLKVGYQPNGSGCEENG